MSVRMCVSLESLVTFPDNRKELDPSGGTLALRNGVTIGFFHDR